MKGESSGLVDIVVRHKLYQLFLNQHFGLLLSFLGLERREVRQKVIYSITQSTGARCLLPYFVLCFFIQDEIYRV